MEHNTCTLGELNFSPNTYGTIISLDVINKIYIPYKAINLDKTFDYPCYTFLNIN